MLQVGIFQKNEFKSCESKHNGIQHTDNCHYAKRHYVECHNVVVAFFQKLVDYNNWIKIQFFPNKGNLRP